MVWQLDERRATFDGHELHAEVDLQRPADGISQIVLRGEPQSLLQLFRLTAEAIDGGSQRCLAESYVRGIDLVASYSETSDAPVSLGVYWRAAVDTNTIGGFEIWISEQTSQLESDPRLTCASRLPTGDVLRLDNPDDGSFATLKVGPQDAVHLTRESGSGAILIRPHGADWSYGEMVHPADFTELTIGSEDDVVVVSSRIFDREHLEKGVIRRARLRGTFVARQDDEKRILESYRRFAQSELPLTV